MNKNIGVISTGIDGRRRSSTAIRFNGVNNYIDTGIQGKSDLKIECRFKMNTIINNAQVFGSLDNPIANRMYTRIQSDGSFIAGYGSNATFSAYDPNGYNILIFDDNIFILNGNVGSPVLPKQTFNNQHNIFLAALNSHSTITTNYINCNFDYFKITDKLTGNKLIDLFPVEAGMLVGGNVAQQNGFYDKVSNTFFYSPAGSLEFLDINNSQELIDKFSYGVKWNINDSNPAMQRIGNPDLHRSLPWQTKSVCELTSDAGTTNQILPLTGSWETSDRSGASGQVMKRIQPIWYRAQEDASGNCEMRVSERQLPGFSYYPGGLFGCYEGSIQRSTGKLCSVVNLDPDYRGGNNQSAWDGSYRSVLGRPVTMMSRTRFRTAARARGADTQWNQQDYNLYKFGLFWMYYIEYANRNCQLPFNAAKDSNGFSQGGLGNGVTTLASADWSTLNGYYPFIPCGYTDSLGNGSGEIAYNVDVNGDQSKIVTVMVPRYRGIENPFGHIWKWTDGINIDVKTDADGGTSQVYVSEKPSAYNDANMIDYTHRGNCARTAGYIKQLIFGSKGDISPKEVGGGTTTYWCDYSDTNITASALRGLLLGGAAYHGAAAGFAFSNASSAPSAATAVIGSRLCFIPSET